MKKFLLSILGFLLISVSLFAQSPQKLTSNKIFEKIQKLYPSKSFEELAREKRYQFFDAIMHIYSSKHILTAHHLDDKIETFFFNLARGSKLTGLINMKAES